MKKVIFDNDIGIDDAMALLFLHYSPEVDLVAITTGFGNASVEDTTRNALFIKQKFSIDAPVHAGASKSVGEALLETYPDFVHGKNGLGDIEITPPTILAESTSAAQAIIDIVKANPHQISIVAVGRMTNVAFALDMAPEIAGLVKELVVMGGVFGYNDHRGNVTPVAEANIVGDPTAADRVFTAGMPTTIVGLDVTEEAKMTEAYMDRIRSDSGSAGEFIYQISRFYFDFYEQRHDERVSPMHDASAVAYLLRPDLYETKSAVIRVVTEGIAIGQTISGEGKAEYISDHWRNLPHCNFCVGVNADAVLELYATTLALAAEG